MFSSNTSQVDGGYQISRSLRFNSADSAYLNRTPASAGNRRTWTWSSWVKLNKSGTQNMFTANIFSSGSDSLSLRFYLDTATLQIFNNGSGTSSVNTTAVFRDYSAWYHVVFAVDTTQATASDRVKIYINGVQQATTGTITLNYDTPVNSTSWASGIGAWNNGNFGMDAYMTEINFIDGQALTPSSFGETNGNTGVWEPKRYSGSYGTNGFYLTFQDNSNTTAATLGKDYSGNGNNWTPNNFSVSAGAGNDSLVDTPTPYGVDTGAGGTVRGNYCTLNPLDKAANASALNGNLDASSAGGSWIGIRSTFGMQSGKWYCEYTPTSGTFHIVSISQPQASTSGYIVDNATAWGYQYDGTKITNNTASSYGSSWGVGDIIGIAFDADAGTLTFYKNNVSQGVAFSGLTSGPYLVGLGFYPTATGTFNFGQRPFAYTAPSGFKALCTQNLPTPAIGATSTTQAGKYFNPVLWTGNDANPRTITGVGFQPDFVWVKLRNAATNHFLQDAVRGVTSTDTRSLVSNNTDAETNFYSPNGAVTGFASDGFTTSGGTANSNLNLGGFTYVAWNWKANGAGSTNTAGSITSTVSANTTSGFSIVTFTGTGSTATIGHGLGTAPALIIGKKRSATSNWFVYHVSVGASAFLYLNTTDPTISSTGAWGGVAPTSTVFTAGAGFNDVNGATYVAYCFAPVAGYSAFGSYTGNGSTDGPFVFCGFRPAFVLTKLSSATSAASEWWLYDTKRGTFNVLNAPLYPNGNYAESPTSALDLDILSNGFKSRSNNGTVNGSGNTYIFAAFAEAPFKYALAR